MDLLLSVQEMGSDLTRLPSWCQEDLFICYTILAPVGIQKNREQLQVKSFGVPGFGALLLCLPFFLQSFVSLPNPSLSSYEWA